MDKLKSILELAGEHMRARHAGRHKISNNVKHSTIEVKCVMCYRKMTTTKDENPPFYCYKCHDEAEGVFGRG